MNRRANPDRPEAETPGERLRRLREAAGLTQADLAGSTLSPSYVSLIEAGRRTPTAGTAERLAAALGTTAAHLLHGDDGRTVALDLDLDRAEYLLLKGRYQEAHELLTASTGHLDPTADRRRWRRAAWCRAGAGMEAGRPEGALDVLERLMATAEPGDDAPTSTEVAAELCAAYLAAGDVDLAVRLGERELGELRPNDPATLAVGTVALRAHLRAGNTQRASRISAELLLAASAQGDATARAEALSCASVEAQGRGEAGLALAHARSALALASAGAAERSVARARVAAAEALLSTGGPGADDALRLLRMAAEAFGGPRDAEDLVRARLGQAVAHLLAGRPRDALTASRRVRHAAPPDAPVRAIALALLVESLAARAVGATPRAAGLAAEARSTLSGVTPERRDAETYAAIATVLVGSGDPVGARQAYEQALSAAGVHGIRDVAYRLVTAQAPA